MTAQQDCGPVGYQAVPSVECAPPKPDLPLTGADVGIVAGLGVLLIAAGVALKGRWA